MPKNDNPQAIRFLASMEEHGEREAGIRFSEENPLSKSANAGKKTKWAKELCVFLNDHYDDETIKAIRILLWNRQMPWTLDLRWNMMERPIT